MSVAAPKMKLRRLRVAIVAADPERREELSRLVVEDGHTVEAQMHAADVVLADARFPMTEKPLVTLGADDREQAGSLPRDASSAQLDAALRSAAAGLVVRLAESGNGFGAAHDGGGAALLTPREVEILSSIAAGFSNKVIARRLDISLHTVKYHVESLFRKLGARTRAEAVARGLERRRAETVDL